MAKVKESKKTRMVVVPYDPKRRVFMLLFVSVLLGLAFVAGYYFSNVDYLDVRSQRDSLLVELASLNQERKDRQRQVAQLEIDANVDQQATNKVREGMADLRQEISELNSEISFYKGLMAPKDGEKGISIRSLELRATTNARKYQFKMVLQQFATEHRLLSGNVNVSVVGKQAGRDLTLSLSDLSEDVGNKNIKYRFKYFQNIEGGVLLPEGFEPSRIDVVIRGSGKKPVYLEQKFGWLSQEA
ncbi:MAG: DUF6776 family protein [Pseudomonadales bacterium]